MKIFFDINYLDLILALSILFGGAFVWNPIAYNEFLSIRCTDFLGYFSFLTKKL
jgi:hypothetical protein